LWALRVNACKNTSFPQTGLNSICYSYMSRPLLRTSNFGPTHTPMGKRALSANNLFKLSRSALLLAKHVSVRHVESEPIPESGPESNRFPESGPENVVDVRAIDGVTIHKTPSHLARPPLPIRAFRSLVPVSGSDSSRASRTSWCVGWVGGSEIVGLLK